MSNNFFDFSERFVEMIISRIRFLCSIETILSIGLVLLLRKIPVIQSWLNPPFDIASFTTSNYRIYRDLEYLRFVVLVLIVMTIVFGTGEFIRRKFKFKSILFDKTKK